MSPYPKRILAAVFAAFVVVVGLTATEAQQTASNPRIALVVGNATYRDAALTTTANDAGLVAQTLQAAGFDVVGARDLDGQSLRTALRDFLQKAAAAGPDMQAFVYLSGRGVQYNGDNYFVPVDAQINRDADVPIEAIRIADFTHALAATPGKARIIVLDAARANPYAAQGSPLAPGLALVDPEAGELIAFNAAPGTLAGDEQGPYGVYGKTLAGAIRQGGVDIVQAFDQTRVSVNAETQGALLPWSASKLGGPFYVFERAADAPPIAAASPAQIDRRPIASFSAEDAYAAAIERDTIEGYREFLAAYPNSDQVRRVRAILAVRREASYWRHTVRADTPRAYWTYLRTYPRGPHVADAQRRLAMLSADFQPPPDFRPEAYANLPPPPPDERFYEEQPVYAFDDFGPPPPPPPVQYVYVEDDDWRDLPPPPPPPEVGVLPVLGVALPIAVGAVGYRGLYHHGGIAPRGEPRFRQPPPAPPPLPANIKPVAPPAPVAAVAQSPNATAVKPLRPIGRRGPPGGSPPRAPGAPATPVGATAPPVLQANPGAPPAPGRALKPLPVPPAPGSPPAAALPAQAVKPLPGAAAPVGANPPAVHAAPGGKPLPAPVAPPATATAPVAPGKPLPAVPGGQPLPTPVAPAPTAAAPAAPTARGGKPLPTPQAPPTAAVAPPVPAATGGKPLPTAPSGKLAPAAAPLPAAIKAAAPPVQAPKPNVAAQPPAAAPRAAAPPPAAHAPAPAALAPSIPRPAPAAVRVPAAPAPHLAPPAVRASPPPAAVAPALRQPPPAVRAPPPPAAVAPALRQPPPVVRVQPRVAQPQACGRPGLPPCPK